MGYWGPFQPATPVSCDSTTGTQLPQKFLPFIVIVISAIAPIGGDNTLLVVHSAGVTTTTLKNFDNFPVRWYVSSLNAIETGGGANQNTVLNVLVEDYRQIQEQIIQN